MTTIKKIVKRASYVLSALAVTLAAIPAVQANALQVTSRSLTLSNSAPGNAGGTAVTYTFAFTPAQTTNIKSVNIDICDSASGTCTPGTTGVPSGLTTTGAAVGTVSGLGSGGSWTGSFGTNGRLRITNSSSAGAPSAASVQFTGITNPNATNTTFYARITTYSDAAYTTAIDTGTVATSTANQIQLSASVDETLVFCTGTSGVTSSSCAGATGTAVNLGALTASSTGTGTSQIGVSTNANSGYAVTVNGATLTSGSNTIAALASQTASSQGSAQFGLNLKANTTPSVGSEVAGSGTATATANYGTSNQFRFVTGDQVASKNSADAFRLFTVSYIANIPGNQPAGTYTATMTYIATATF